MRLAFVLGIACAVAAAGQSVTFHKDVAPVLQARCQECHRAGEIGPMPLMSYAEARPWARSIKTAVLSKKMPPWFADPATGHFQNDRSLSQKEIETLVAWADSGAPEGNLKDAPPPRIFVEGWNIGNPEMVLEMPTDYEVPARGTIEYTYTIVPTGFTEDRWVKAMEVRPGNRAVVHHANIHIRRPESKWLRQYPVGVPFVPAEQKTSTTAGSGLIDENIAGFTPGKQTVLLADDQAKLIPAGAEIVFQMHYTSNGKAGKDRTKLGLIFSKTPPVKRVARISAANATFVIPPGAPDHRVDGSTTLQADAELVSLKPHMHLRGKWMEFRAVYPTGETELLLSVPRYDFNWQLEFILDHPKKLPKGTRLEASGGFDNSPNNRYNPDPKAEVRWGDQSWEEMMVGFFEVAFDPKLDIPNLMIRGALDQGR